MKFDIGELRSNTVWQVHRIRDRVQIDPEYQRLSDIWTLEKRQLLIDTLINGFDVPKLYFHKFTSAKKVGSKSFEYAIVDGKQRLEAIWNFIDGKIPLSDEFEYLHDPSVKAAGMTYGEIGREFPELKADFDGFTLSVVMVETDDIDIIEDLFSRLNEAATLTAAEKRNAFHGPLPSAIRRLAKTKFFTESLPFRNARYRHFDLAAKFLLAEDAGKITDTKKTYLDSFVRQSEKKPRTKMPDSLKLARANVARMSGVFSANDSLLRQVGMVMVYYHLFRIANAQGWLNDITRKKLVSFNRDRARNRELAETDLANADYDLVEFDRLSQSPNDRGALRFRVGVMMNKVFGRDVSTGVDA